MFSLKLMLLLILPGFFALIALFTEKLPSDHWLYRNELIAAIWSIPLMLGIIMLFYNIDILIKCLKRICSEQIK